MERLPVFGAPNHLLIQRLSTMPAQLLDDPCALIEVVPKSFGVEELELMFFVTGQFTQTGIMEQQPSILVDHAKAGRTELQSFAKLTLVLGRLDSKSRPAFHPHG